MATSPEKRTANKKTRNKAVYNQNIGTQINETAKGTTRRGTAGDLDIHSLTIIRTKAGDDERGTGSTARKRP